MRHMARFVESAGDAGDVVVADERLRHKGVQESIVPLQGVVQLVEVAVIERAPGRLPQFVLGHRVETRFGHHRGKITVDDLGDNPRIAVPLADPRQHLCPEPFGHRVSSVQAPTIDTAIQPVRHHVGDVVHHLVVTVIQRDQVIVTFERPESARLPDKPLLGLSIAVECRRGTSRNRFRRG